MKTHWLPPFPLSFSCLRFSCFLATKSRQNCRGRDENVEKPDHPDPLLRPGNAKKHKKRTFSCFVLVGAEIARTGGHASKTPSSDLVRPTCCHHCILEKQPFSRVFRFSRKVKNCQPYSCHRRTRHENALAAFLPPQFRISAFFLFFGDQKSSKL